jgi:hypothetical protein
MRDSDIARELQAQMDLDGALAAASVDTSQDSAIARELQAQVDAEAAGNAQCGDTVAEAAGNAKCGDTVAGAAGNAQADAAVPEGIQTSKAQGPARPTHPPPPVPVTADNLESGPKKPSTPASELPAEATPHAAFHEPVARCSAESTRPQETDSTPALLFPCSQTSVCVDAAGRAEEALEQEAVVEVTRWHAYVDDDSGEVYYFNAATGQTEWDLPHGGQVVEEEGDCKEEADDGGGSEEEEEVEDDEAQMQQDVPSLGDSSGWSSSDDEMATESKVCVCEELV